MKFKLRTAGHIYSEEESKELIAIGFDMYCKVPFNHWFVNRKVSPIIEFVTIEQLIKFIDKWGNIIIEEDKDDINRGDENKVYSMTIYDGYVE